jgi:hypothetical protein
MAGLLLGALAAAHGWSQAAAAKPFVYDSHDLFYELKIPAGWEFREEEDSNRITISKGDARVIVAAAKTEDKDTVESLLEARKKLLLEQCPAVEFRDHGKAPLASAAGAYFTAYCPGSGLPTITRVAGSRNYWKFFLFSSTAPVTELPAVQADLDRMAASLKAGDGLPEGKAERMRAR